MLCSVTTNYFNVLSVMNICRTKSEGQVKKTKIIIYLFQSEDFCFRTIFSAKSFQDCIKNWCECCHHCLGCCPPQDLLHHHQSDCQSQHHVQDQDSENIQHRPPRHWCLLLVSSLWSGCWSQDSSHQKSRDSSI